VWDWGRAEGELGAEEVCDGGWARGETGGGEGEDVDCWVGGGGEVMVEGGVDCACACAGSGCAVEVDVA
jgi:hypothetical protein